MWLKGCFRLLQLVNRNGQGQIEAYQWPHSLAHSKGKSGFRAGWIDPLRLPSKKLRLALFLAAAPELYHASSTLYPERKIGERRKDGG
jgi:hypothetical protein